MENVMIGFKDFLPKKGAKFWTLSQQWESVSDAVDRANEWIQQENVDVINVETVLLPDLRGKSESSSARAVASQSSFSIGPFGSATKWRQVVRVWYRSSV